MIAVAKPRSLVSTLFIRVVVLLAGAIAAIGAIAFWSARQQIYEIYDLQLIAGTQLLHALAKEELEEYAGKKESPPPSVLFEEDVESFNAYGRWRMFRIWRGSQLIAKSANGPARVAVPGDAGFIDLVDGAEPWRIYHLAAKDLGLSIAVGEPLTQRDLVVADFALTLIAPLLLLVPAAVGLIWLTLLDGLSALRRLAAALHAKSGSDLAPLEPSQWPRDIGEILTSINGLLNRLDRSFRQTLRFTDHAAHQLRTPLAGLKLNAQMIEAEKDPEQQRAIVMRIRKGAERAAALVEQLLTLAKLDGGAFRRSPIDVTAVAKSVLEDFAPIAAANDVRLALTAGLAVLVQADAVLLKLILSNLIDNAIKQSPSGGEVAVEAVREPAHHEFETVRLTVRDHGPGIPVEERQRVFERFYRIDSDKPGVGLGLSIVEEALSQIGGSISLDSPATGRGLLAVVRLRAA